MEIQYFLNANDFFYKIKGLSKRVDYYDGKPMETGWLSRSRSNYDESLKDSKGHLKDLLETLGSKISQIGSCYITPACDSRGVPYGFSIMSLKVVKFDDTHDRIEVTIDTQPPDAEISKGLDLLLTNSGLELRKQEYELKPQSNQYAIRDWFKFNKRRSN